MFPYLLKLKHNLLVQWAYARWYPLTCLSPSSIHSDETFSSFSAHGHLPLKVLLGKPLYVEVRINSPKPEATLIVHYCVAYTRSATNALVLLYEGYVWQGGDLVVGIGLKWWWWLILHQGCLKFSPTGMAQCCAGRTNSSSLTRPPCLQWKGWLQM